MRGVRQALRARWHPARARVARTIGSARIVWYTIRVTPVVVVFFVSIVLAGSALTFAKRTREPCTACRKGELVHGRDFAWHCKNCKARFVRERGSLVQRDA